MGPGFYVEDWEVLSQYESRCFETCTYQRRPLSPEINRIGNKKAKMIDLDESDMLENKEAKLGLT